MSGEIVRKWDMLRCGQSIDVMPEDLCRITLRDFLDVVRETSYGVEVIRLEAGHYRIEVVL